MEDRLSVLHDLLLHNLYDHLCHSYGFEWSREEFFSESRSMHGLNALLAFKSDIQLEEFEVALDRLHRGEFGTCLHCHQEISTERLKADLSCRFCQTCWNALGIRERGISVLDRQ